MRHFACYVSKNTFDVQAGVIKDLVLLACVGVRPVLVHGGGPEINIWLNKLGIQAEFKNGLRVTDGESSQLTCKYQATGDQHKASYSKHAWPRPLFAY